MNIIDNRVNKPYTNHEDYYRIHFYKKTNGEVPIINFLEEIEDVKLKNKVLKFIQILQEYGRELYEPYTKYLKDGIYELRIHHSSNYARCLYFFYCDDLIIMTNGFIKKTNKTPSKEIKTALNNKKDFIKRMEGMQDE